MNLDEYGGTLWLNGELVDWQSAKTHVLAHGLHYASSVFEGERVYKGTIFKHQQHTDRLFRSAALLDMTIPFSNQELYDAGYAAVRARGVENGYVRPVVWRGAETMAISAHATAINVAVAAFEFGTYFDPEKKLEGISLGIPSYRRPPPDCMPFEAKAAATYSISTICKHETDARGFDDALLLDWRGQIAEVSAANIFFVANGELHTPTPDCFLNGITRQTVFEIAQTQGLTIHERAVLPSELASFEEVFVVGTSAEITPVNRIEAHAYSVGPVTRTVFDAYNKLVLEPS